MSTSDLHLFDQHPPVGASRLENDLLELRRRIEAEVVGWQEANAVRQSIMGDRPWASLDWKQRRDAKIGRVCQQCGTDKPPLVLQHTRKRIPFEDLLQSMKREHRDQWQQMLEQGLEALDFSTLPLDTQGCPLCGSGTIRYRQKAKTWKCESRVGGVPCHNVFETPISIKSPSKKRELEAAVYNEQRQLFDQKHQFGKEATILAIDQDLQYLAMVDTITLCKRCAFVADKTKMVLCELCKTSYHKIQYDRCSACAGIKKEPVLEEPSHIESVEEFEQDAHNQGTLLLMNMRKDGFGITVPQTVLSDDQRILLREHLRVGIQRKPSKRKSPFLMWEYWIGGTVMIDCVTLSQKQLEQISTE